jgi:glycosyltransferase involved in cell wall biosynthesis
LTTSPSLPRIALCIEYSIFQFGGTEVLVAELIRQLARDFQLILVSADRSIAGTWIEALVSEQICWDPAEDPAAAAQNLAAALDERQVDLVHFHFGWNYAWSTRSPRRSPLVAASRRGLRCIVTNHGFFSGLEGYCAIYRPLWMKLALLPAAWMFKVQVVANALVEVAVSQHDWRSLRRWYPPVRNRFRQIYHSKLPSAPAALSNSSREKRIICVGTVGARKGQPFLVKAFAALSKRYPEWRLEILGRAGDPQTEIEFKKLLEEHPLGDRLEWVQGLDDKAIADRLANSEIFAMPSLYEGLGLSLQEALYYGCACIASRAGGITDLVQHERTGLLVEPGDVESLRMGLERLIEDDELRARLKAAGPVFVREKRMSAPGMADAYRQLYHSFL